MAWPDVNATRVGAMIRCTGFGYALDRPVELLRRRTYAETNELIGRPGVRVQCDACGEEIINQREVATDSCWSVESSPGSGSAGVFSAPSESAARSIRELPPPEYLCDVDLP